MTSYTRKLHLTDPSKARAIHRLRYGKSTSLASFSLAERDALDVAVALGLSQQPARIEPEFEVADRLGRWADRGWK